MDDPCCGCPCGVAVPALIALMAGAAYGGFSLLEWLLGSGLSAIFGA
jgi:hypothetical protein